MAAADVTPEAARSGWLAAVLSAIIPGAGQFYLGHKRRAAWLFAPLVVLAIGAIIYRQNSTSADLLSILVQPSYLNGIIVANIAIVAWRVWAVVDAYRLGPPLLSQWVLAGAGAAVLAFVAIPHIVAVIYSLQGIDTLTTVFVTDEPTAAATTPTTGGTTTTTHVEIEPTGPITVERELALARTVEYQSVGLIFRAGVGDPDAIAIQRELREGTDSAPFVNFDSRVGENRITILLAGGDRGPGRDGLRTDTMMIATIDTDTGQAAIFGIPRNYKRIPLPDHVRHDFDELTEEEWEYMPDLDEDGWPDDFAPDEDMDGFPDDWEDLDGDGIPDQPEVHCHCYPDLLNHMHGDAAEYVSHKYPNSRDVGMDLLADTLGNMIGLEVDYWLLVDMSGFVRLIDAMGGVDVYVTNPLHVGVSPSEEGLPTAIVNVQEGPATLSGSEALAYVRWRRGSSDYVRMQRQRCLIRSVADSADPVTMLRSFTAITDAIEDSVVSNIPLSVLPDIIQIAASVDLNDVATVGLVPPHFNDGRTPGNYPIPDYERMRRTVAETLANPVADTSGIGEDSECGI